MYKGPKVEFLSPCSKTLITLVSGGAETFVFMKQGTECYASASTAASIFGETALSVVTS